MFRTAPDWDGLRVGVRWVGDGDGVTVGTTGGRRATCVVRGEGRRPEDGRTCVRGPTRRPWEGADGETVVTPRTSKWGWVRKGLETGDWTFRPEVRDGGRGADEEGRGYGPRPGQRCKGPDT